MILNMTHTGVVVTDMQRSLEFYRDVLGLEIERDFELEGDFISQMTDYPSTRMHIIYLGREDLNHSLELIQYMNPEGEPVPPRELKQIGATHVGFVIDDMDALYKELTAKGAKFANPPALRADAKPAQAMKGCYVQDPDGNWLEFAERAPA